MEIVITPEFGVMFGLVQLARRKVQLSKQPHYSTKAVVEPIRHTWSYIQIFTQEVLLHIRQPHGKKLISHKHMPRCKNRCVEWDIFITQRVVGNCFSRNQLCIEKNSNPSSSIHLCLLAKVSISRWRRLRWQCFNCCCYSYTAYMCNYHPKYTNTKWENGIKLSATTDD